MVWIERTNDSQQAIKTPEMEERIVWNDNGIARVTEHDAEIAVDLGAARRRDSEELEDEDVAEPEPERPDPEPVPDPDPDADVDQDQDQGQDTDDLELEGEDDAEAERDPLSSEMDGVNDP